MILYTLKAVVYNSGVVNGREVCHQKPATLYDAGGWFLISVLFGIAFVGVVADYFWNYLIFSLTLRWLRFNVNIKRKFIYCLIITGLGLLIDWLYYELTWGYLVLGSLSVSPIFSRPGSQPILELSTILIPVVVLAMVNFLVSYLYSHVTAKQAIVVGTVMGIFTAPWLIVGFVLLSA
jgi:hypothetical protein